MIFIPLDDWLDGIVFHKNLSLELCEFFLTALLLFSLKQIFLKEIISTRILLY